MAEDGTLVLPGDLIALPAEGKVHLGPGVRAVGDTVCCSRLYVMQLTVSHHSLN
jgi:hypothetical protein